MAVGIKMSLGIKLRCSVGGAGGVVQTLAMLMNAPCSLIMSHAERSFLLAIFLMKYHWMWVVVWWCLFRGQQNCGGGKKIVDGENEVVKKEMIIITWDL